MNRMFCLMIAFNRIYRLLLAKDAASETNCKSFHHSFGDKLSRTLSWQIWISMSVETFLTKIG